MKKIVALVAGHDDSVPIAANLLEMLKALKNLDVAEINKVDDDYKVRIFLSTLILDLIDFRRTARRCTKSSKPQ